MMPDRSAVEVDRRMALAREWDEVVAQVRLMPGFEDFLRPPPIERLLPAAAGGPVVILTVSRWRCDALIVQESGVEVVELPGLTPEIVDQRVRSYLAAVGSRGRDADAAEAPDDEAELTSCLRWMWDSFAERILDRLGCTSTPGPGETWPRVWWCPTGLLTLLPLHAAGDHESPGAAVLDRVVSSYTPTLRALVEARTAPGGTPPRMLFVGMPETPGQADLPNVRIEEELVGRLFAGRCTVLPEDARTPARVLDALPEHGWVHFACHGVQNLDDPSRGGVIVEDGTLTVTDLSSRQYRGEFAYLSGCKTAVGGRNLPDEAITLAAALHYTGYRHVVATLWSVGDAEAAQVAGSVYEQLVRDGEPRSDGAALALHIAVRRLRTAHPDRPGVWTPFAHTGP